MTRPTQGVSCQVCGKQRAPGEIHSKPSRLWRGKNVIICNKCYSEKKEPRSFIVILARAGRLKAVEDYIIEDRYEGRTIEAKEIIKRS